VTSRQDSGSGSAAIEAVFLCIIYPQNPMTSLTVALVKCA